jgi:hypothetical protein
MGTKIMLLFFCGYVSASGVHHNNPGETLAPNLDSFFGWLKGEGPKPIVLWRETLPQHFDTPDGTFQKGNQKRCVHNRDVLCKPIKVSGEQKFNSFSNPRVAAFGIPIVEVFDMVKPYWYLHRGCIDAQEFVDCTHFPPGSPINRFLVLQVVAAIDIEIKKSLGVMPDDPRRDVVNNTLDGRDEWNQSDTFEKVLPLFNSSEING